MMKSAMKSKILSLLRLGGGVVSGEAVSTELGISRVSVWKHIGKLKELGYEIESTPNGYRLLGSPDGLFPWEFGHRSDSIHYFEEISSTMDTARDFARKGCPDLTVVIAERQTKGRGRLSRTWISDDGGLYFSVILRPPIPPVFCYRVNFAASLCLAKVLRRMFAIDAKVKWPNDILVNGGKLCGMLSEMEAEADRVSFINLGIGINVNNDPSPKEQKAVSLKVLLGKNIPRRTILSAFLDEFELMSRKIVDENIIPEWKKFTGTLGRPVRIVTLNDTIEGIARDVEKDGALMVETSDGTLRKVLYGDCFYATASQE
jgi:BirA family transcriptional regulator, biotin operon repressor / biotin---[acetyl-CoA-carboxylase] ligase